MQKNGEIFQSSSSVLTFFDEEMDWVSEKGSEWSEPSDTTEILFWSPPDAGRVSPSKTLRNPIGWDAADSSGIVASLSCKFSLIIQILSGQIIMFHQPGFPWNKGTSLTKPPFGENRSCEVAN